MFSANADGCVGIGRLFRESWRIIGAPSLDLDPRMKAVFINRYFYPDHSATSQLLSDLVFELAASGQTVHVITSRQIYDNPNAVLPKSEAIRGIQISRVWTSRFGRGKLLLRASDYLTFYLSAGWCLLSLASRGDIIVAKTDPPLISVVAWLIAKLKGATLINWLQDLYPEVAVTLQVRGMKLVSPVLRHLRNLSLRHARSNVVIGERMAQVLEKEGVDSRKIVVIHNWVNGDDIVPIDAEHNALREAWGFQGRFVVGYSGNMGRVHDFDTIIEAAKLLDERNRDIVFLFIGGGAKQPWIEEKVAGLSNVVFKPYQPQERLAQSLSVADVHLVSLRPELEGLIVPSKFYGVAAVGRSAIIVGDPEGEIARIVRIEDCGYVVPSSQAGVLTSCIESAYKNRVENINKGLRARCAFDHRFSKNIAMKGWKALLV